VRGCFPQLDTKEKFVIRSKTVILATGGIGASISRVFRRRTTMEQQQMAVIANRAGARIIFMDAIQFHLQEQLIRSAHRASRFRGLSRVERPVVNGEGKRYINELETRDVTSSATIRRWWTERMGVDADGNAGVWLDTPLVELKQGGGTIHRIFLTFSIDSIRSESILQRNRSSSTYPTLPERGS